MYHIPEGDCLKVLLFSDSHGNVANMADTVRLEQPDQILHLGDLLQDADALSSQFPHIPLVSVPGNCDGRRPDLPEERVLELDGCRILMTHGHIYQVKMGIGAAVRAAREVRADLLLFGHTHQAFCEYENGMWVVNPGSAGSLTQPSYAVLILEAGGAVCYLSKI
ncbi:metallophosphoesterase [Flavonifractor hominis]|uniref:metallophosphoesterase n=1 Tax=Flavonifractor hominis TaxID=3133178 RepID=UPI0032C19C01